MASGTTHVDVNDVGACGLCDPRAFCHPVSLAAGKLNDVRSAARGLAAENGHGPSANEIVAGGHFGNDQPRPQCFGKTAERPVGDPRHRRQKNPVGDRNIPNRE